MNPVCGIFLINALPPERYHYACVMPSAPCLPAPSLGSKPRLMKRLPAFAGPLRPAPALGAGRPGGCCAPSPSRFSRGPRAGRSDDGVSGGGSGSPEKGEIVSQKNIVYGPAAKKKYTTSAGHTGLGVHLPHPSPPWLVHGGRWGL